MQGSMTRRKRNRTTGGHYYVYRAQLGEPANIERTFSEVDYGCKANARAKAEEWLVETRRAIRAGTWVDPRKPQPSKPGETTVREVAASWRRSWDLLELSEKTRLNYGSILDRRVLRPSVTGKGLNALESCDESVDLIEANMLDHLSTEDVDVLQDLLARCAHALETGGRDTPF